MNYQSQEPDLYFPISQIIGINFVHQTRRQFYPHSVQNPQASCPNNPQSTYLESLMLGMRIAAHHLINTYLDVLSRVVFSPPVPSADVPSPRAVGGFPL